MNSLRQSMLPPPVPWKIVFTVLLFWKYNYKSHGSQFVLRPLRLQFTKAKGSYHFLIIANVLYTAYLQHIEQICKRYNMIVVFFLHWTLS